MKLRDELSDLPEIFRRLRQERGVSKLQLADEAGVNVSVVHRAESGSDARLSTWIKLLDGLGYCVFVQPIELDESVDDLLKDEAERRRVRRLDGLASR